MTKVAVNPEKIEIDFTDEAITPSAGSLFLSRMAKVLGLQEALQRGLRLKRRDRGATDSEMMLSLVYNLAQGDGALVDVDRLRADDPRQKLLGLSEVPGSRRLGEYLVRFDDEAVEKLLGISRLQGEKVASTVIQAEVRERGYVPIFPDGSEIEVDGEYFENAGFGYTKNLQYWLHSVFVGSLWASQRLQPGGVGVTHGWKEQFDREVSPLLPGGTPVWVRGDNAYYFKEFVEYCQDHSWGYSISVTSDTFKKPLKDILSSEDPEWTWITDDQTEEATLIYHQPGRWKKEQAYVAIRSYWDGKQKLLHPRLMFILVSRDDLPLKELVHRHREKQGQENLQKGPLVDLDLHHPPCLSFQANRAFYTAAQIAHNLLIAIQHLLLPQEARTHRIRTVIRDLIRVAGRLVRHGRRWILRLAKTSLRLDWLNHAADRLDTFLTAPAST